MHHSDKPIRVILPLPSSTVELELPPGTVVLAPAPVEPLASPEEAIARALTDPLGAPPLSDLARDVLARSPRGKAVVVISDNTRPVPYSGRSGILWPIIEKLLSAGFPPTDIAVIVACGTHRPLAEDELAQMLDGRVYEAGISVRCHDAFAHGSLAPLGTTHDGTEITMDREYREADLRILTGLVESHLMAGASGGRKSICPGLLGVESVRQFHGATVLAHPRSTDLALEGNPCHALSLEIARMAPADFIVNVTAREDGAVVGVFAGGMEEAHASAVAHLRSYTSIPLSGSYDVVIVHAGKVGVNHYQSAKAASAAGRAVKPGGHIILVADTTDPDPVGGPHYRALLARLREVGPAEFGRLILDPNWKFVPDQWQVQVWAKVLERVPARNLHYFSPQTSPSEHGALPCRGWEPWMDALVSLGPELQIVGFVHRALETALAECAGDGAAPSVAFLAAGPYGIPVGQAT